MLISKKSNIPAFMGVIKIYTVRLEMLWIETPPYPFQHILMFLMVWIFYRFKELRVAMNPSAIFRRTCPSTRYANGVLLILVSGLDSFQADGMLPIITEIIRIRC